MDISFLWYNLCARRDEHLSRLKNLKESNNRWKIIWPNKSTSNGVNFKKAKSFPFNPVLFINWQSLSIKLIDYWRFVLISFLTSTPFALYYVLNQKGELKKLPNGIKFFKNWTTSYHEKNSISVKPNGRTWKNSFCNSNVTNQQ